MFSYLHHIGDFNKATRHLSRIERSIYRDLIELYYETEKALPDDLKYICRLVIAHSNEEVTAVEQSLKEFFHKNDDGWVHIRCELEIEQFKSNTSQKSIAGKASAAARAAKRQQIINGRSTGVGTGDERQANGNPTNHKPLTLNQKPIKDNSPQAADSVIEIFEHWKIQLNHPRAKLDEKRKKIIGNALKLGYQLQDLMDAIEGCSKSPYHMGKDGRNVTVYDDLELILRDAKHIDQFLKINITPQAKFGVSYATNQQPNGFGGGKEKASPSDRIRAQARVAIEHLDAKDDVSSLYADDGFIPAESD